MSNYKPEFEVRAKRGTYSSIAILALTEAERHEIRWPVRAIDVFHKAFPHTTVRSTPTTLSAYNSIRTALKKYGTPASSGRGWIGVNYR